MRRVYILIFSFIFCTASFAQVFQVDTVYYHGDPNNRINLLIMGDGYMNTEMAQFRSDAQSVADYFFSIEPFHTYRNFFNFFAIEVVSNQSGTNHPGTASDEPGNQPVAVVDNYLKTTFDHGGTHRCVFSNQTSIVYSVANANFPNYDYINVIINSTYYGGCAGGIAFTTMNSSSPEVFAHEFGHMFGQLADEYEYGGSGCVGGTSQGINVSQQTDTSLLVWKKWLNAPAYPTPNGTSCSSIGLYPGANYCDSNWYRPKCDCKMRALGYPYCEVCYEQFIYKISTNVNYIEGHQPANATQNFCGNDQQMFSVNVLDNEDSTVRVQWFVDNVRVTNNTDNFLFNASLYSPGNHQLKATAYDTTLHARKPLTSYNQLWNINILNAMVTSNDSLTFCAPDTAMLHAASDSGLTYQWYRNNTLIVGETDSILAVSSSGNYSVVVSNGSCQDTSSQVPVQVNSFPVASVSLHGNDTICSGNSSLLTTVFCGSCIGQWEKDGSIIPGANNDSLTVNTNGSYTVRITNSNDCAALSPAQTIQLSLINAVANGSTTTFCENDSAILDVHPRGMLCQWYFNNVPIPGKTEDSLFVSSQGNYFATLNDGVCIDSSNSISITVHNLPVVSFTGLPDTMCVNHFPALLSGNPAGGIFSGTGVSANSFDPHAAGAGSHPVNYDYEDANGCAGQTSQTVLVDPCAGIDELNDRDISVFPNPVSGKVTVRNNTLSESILSVRIFDDKGQNVLTGVCDKTKPDATIMELDCSYLADGIYMMQIETGKKSLLRRLTVIK